MGSISGTGFSLCVCVYVCADFSCFEFAEGRDEVRLSLNLSLHDLVGSATRAIGFC